MSKLIYLRNQSLLLFITLFVLIISFYLQYMRGLEACPLCLMQRFSAILVAACCLASLLLQAPRYGRIVVLVQLIFAAAGLFFALRHVWLLLFTTSQTPACLPDLDILLRYFPWRDILQSLFWGTGECTKINWHILGLPLPVWSACYFLLALAGSGYILIRLWQSKKN